MKIIGIIVVVLLMLALVVAALAPLIPDRWVREEAERRAKRGAPSRKPAMPVCPPPIEREPRPHVPLPRLDVTA